MRIATPLTVFATAMFMTGTAAAQAPARDKAAGGPNNGASAFIARLLTLDSNGDGRLAKAELKDARLMPLFERGDTNHDGILTQEEMSALYAKETPAGMLDRIRGRPGAAVAPASPPPGRGRRPPGGETPPGAPTPSSAPNQPGAANAPGGDRPPLPPAESPPRPR